MKSIPIAVLAALLAFPAAPGGDEPIRAARSVHLGYPAPDAAAFYLEVTVERTTPGSYFMACGFAHGYFGIQEQGRGRKVVIFSVWDPAGGDHPEKVPEDQRVELIYRDPDVRVGRFGGEGTGGQSFLDHDWKAGETYRFCVRAVPQGKKTLFSGHFYIPEEKAWKHLVTFRTPAGGEPLRGLYSFIEDFRRDGASAGEARRASFGNAWALDGKGEWHALTRARFTASGASWEAKETIDAGTAGGRFYLQTGGDTKTSTPLRSTIELPAGAGKPPEVPPERRPGLAADRGWVNVLKDGELPAPVARKTDDLPLSDQENRGRWVRYAPMTDEFDGDRLDPEKWWDRNPGWKGRQPGWFHPGNVKVSDGKLHLTMRKEEVPEMEKGAGYRDFTCAAVKSKGLVRYGYFEVLARPMASAGSSSFWFYEGVPDRWTEIDVFEIGGRAPGFERKLNMTMHVFKTPEEDRHWQVGGAWKAPSDLVDGYHAYGLEWDAAEIKIYFDGHLVRKGPNTHWHQPLALNFDSETMPEWFGLPRAEDLPSTYSIEYVRAWKRSSDR